MNKLNKLSKAWDQASHRILDSAIDNINAVNKKQLNQFTTQELEQELLNRQTCHFGRLTCTQKAQDYLIKPFNYQRHPTCFNCKQDILCLLKEN